MTRRRSSVPSAPRVPDDLRPATSRDEHWTGCEVRGNADLAVQFHDGRPEEIRESRVIDVRFDGVDLDRLLVTDVVFEDCSFVAASWADASFNRVEFRTCRMTEVVLAGARLDDVRFVDCKLDGANLRMAVGAVVEFLRCPLTGADLYAARLEAARFFGCDLERADVSAARLDGARLHGSRLGGLIGGEQLRGVVIDSSQVLPLALRVFSALGITVDDDPEPEEKKK